MHEDSAVIPSEPEASQLCQMSEKIMMHSGCKHMCARWCKLIEALLEHERQALAAASGSVGRLESPGFANLWWKFIWTLDILGPSQVIAQKEAPIKTR